MTKKNNKDNDNKDKSLNSYQKMKKNKQKQAKRNKVRELTANEKSFADGVIAGLGYSEAYKRSSYKSDKYSRENIGAQANLVMNRPHVKSYIEKNTKQATEKALWTRERALKTLIRVAEETPSLGFGGGNQIVSAVSAANKMCGFDKPEEVVQNKDNTDFRLPAHLVGKSFVDINRDIDNNKYKEIWAEGGRGSLKSTFFIGLKPIELLERNPNMCAIAMRAVGNTIGDSIFSQLIWAIEMLGLQDDYKWIKSPYEITKISTGQKIYFRGLDDAGKIKSIKPPLGMYLGIHLYEEFDQIKGGMEAVRKVDQSLVRGGEIFYRFKCYNTPQSNTHFVNTEKIIPKPGRLLHRSNYLDAPTEWLGKEFIAEATHLKETNPTAYANEYMGEITGTGGMVFTNLEIRDITKEDYAGFNQEYQGLDWGWYPDPNHWTSCYYNANKRILYITDEWQGNKLSNLEIYNELTQKINTGTLDEKGMPIYKQRIKSDVLVMADSAEPKSVQDLKSYGAYIKPVPKPPGSVIYSTKWLANLSKIVIDSKCRATIKEFSEYELEKDKDGNYISVFPDKNNHSIDAVRYATEPIHKMKGK